MATSKLPTENKAKKEEIGLKKKRKKEKIHSTWAENITIPIFSPRLSFF